LIPLAEARARVLAGCLRLPAVAVPLAEALGCVTAGVAISQVDVPPFANSAMDGFAVRAGDTAGASAEHPARLLVVGTVAAGAAPDRPVGPGQALRIMTGAPMPEGADGIAIVEVTTTDGDRVLVHQPARAGQHIRHPGGDIAAGQEVLPEGTALGPGHVGVLASIGWEDVAVYRRPRVGVLSTGDELVQGSEPLRPGQIRDTNRLTLLSLCRLSGFDAVDLGTARDDEEEIRAVFSQGVATCDALISSGGVSMGDFDYVKTVLMEIGDVTWMQVAIRPAKPLAFGTVAGTPVFGLPGNPVSSMVSFELFARPGLRQMMGFSGAALDRPRVRGVTDEAMKRQPDGKLHLDRVEAVASEADGRFHVRPTGEQASHLLRAMALANALALIPDGDGIPAGGDVDLLLLGLVGPWG
jgi:molybdopterin molybdotransferase